MNICIYIIRIWKMNYNYIHFIFDVFIYILYILWFLVCYLFTNIALRHSIYLFYHTLHIWCLISSSHKIPWALKTMKNTGFGQLRKRLFTIKKPLKCRFRGPNIYIYMYILHSVHISATFVDRPWSPCMTRTKTSASRKFVEPWPTVFFHTRCLDPTWAMKNTMVTVIAVYMAIILLS